MNETRHSAAEVPPSILIVDDKVSNLHLLSNILSEKRYRVRPVSDGQTALLSVRNETPDLILLDISMPGLSGFEICERLKSDQQSRDIPIIFISSKDEVFDKVKAFSLGAVDYITKPFHVEEVLVRIKTHLRIGELQKRLTQSNQCLQQEIEERRQAEEILKAGEERYRRLVEDSPDAMIVHHNWTIRYVNAAAEKLFEIYGQAAWQQKNVLDCIHRDDHQCIREYIDNIESSGSASLPLKVRLLRQDDSILYSELTAAPIVYHAQPAVQTMFRDISPRIYAEEQLHKLKKAIETTEVGVTITDQHGLIEYVNPADAAMHGYRVEELLGERSNLFSPEEFHQELPVSGDHFHSPSNWKRERINVRKDGTRFPVKLISNPLLDQQGRICGLVTVCENVTEYRAAEKLLQESELRYRSIFENTTIGIFQASPKGSFLTVNPAFSRLLGYSSPEDLIKQVTDIAEQIYVEAQHWRDIVALLTTTGEPVKAETRCRCRDGGEIIVNLTVWAVETMNEPSPYFEGFIEDISERTRVEHALNTRERYLAALVQIQRRLLEFEGERVYEEILCLLGQSSHACRVSFFENSSDRDGKIVAEQRWSWQDETLESLDKESRALRFLYAEALPECFLLLDQGQTISQDRDELQKTEHCFWQARGTSSLLLLPVMIGGVFYGLISLEACREVRAWDPSEISLLQTAVAAISLARERQLSEQRVQQHAEALQQANKELAVALEELKTTQEERVLSEKMAALAQLIAGIAHEINAPLGTIRSALGKIADVLSQTLEELSEFFRHLSENTTKSFLVLLRRALQQRPAVNATQRRHMRTSVVAFLQNHHIPSVQASADLLVDLGIHDDLESLLPLLREAESQKMLRVAYELAELSETIRALFYDRTSS
ncbi:hypothetical protein CSB45_07530 [candidate division KSB3 bacterium]|uniref:PAS domain S-box protein n=1 Tax=candidate division KSB3 bacterium TaxID=2044937 RepID=A0A2G6E5Z3_9BACT|nr:MAG: hypothetical protein CSB45_07530 [candidate division KSB3 bacterium]